MYSNTLPPTPRQLEILRAVVIYEDSRTAARALGVSRFWVSNALSNLYARLDTDNLLGALKALGWLQEDLCKERPLLP